MPFEFENDEWEVIWSGRDELLPSRPTKPDDLWQAPNRLYNKRVDGNTPPSGGETEKAEVTEVEDKIC